MKSLKIYEYDVTKPYYVINDVITYDVAHSTIHITWPTKSELPQEQSNGKRFKYSTLLVDM